MKELPVLLGIGGPLLALAAYVSWSLVKDNGVPFWSIAGIGMFLAGIILLGMNLAPG